MEQHKCNKESEIAEMHTMIKSMHKELVGNGQPGIIKEFNQFKGGYKFFKWVTSSSLVLAIGAIIKSFLK